LHWPHVRGHWDWLRYSVSRRTCAHTRLRPFARRLDGVASARGDRLQWQLFSCRTATVQTPILSDGFGVRRDLVKQPRPTRWRPIGVPDGSSGRAPPGQCSRPHKCTLRPVRSLRIAAPALLLHLRPGRKFRPRYCRRTHMQRLAAAVAGNLNRTLARVGLRVGVVSAPGPKNKSFANAGFLTYFARDPGGSATSGGTPMIVSSACTQRVRIYLVTCGLPRVTESRVSCHCH